MKRFLLALQFLTVLPIQIKSRIEEKDFGRSLLYFPIVGVLIGLLLFGLTLLLRFLPDLVLGASVLMASVIITGGLHLDGFADTCDGFSGSRHKEEILKIMRDSHVGVMGAIGIVTLLLLKFTLIVSIPSNYLWKSLIMMTTFSRWSQGLACLVCEYARSEGKAKFFIEYANKKDIVIGGLFTFGLFLLLAKAKGVLIFTLTTLCALLFIQHIKRKIGGMTGDTIGAVNELNEVMTLLFYQII